MKIDIDYKNNWFLLDFEFNWTLINAVKEVDGRKWNATTKKWSIPSDLNALKQLRSECFWSKVDLVFTDAAEVKIKRLESDLKEQNVRSKKIESLKEVEDTSLDLSSYLTADLFPYQKIGHKFLEINNGVGIIADEPGLGKTIQAISYAAKYSKNVLVICPASLKLNWQSEIKKFARNATTQVLNSGDEICISKDTTKTHFIIVNFELLIARKKNAQPSTSIMKSISSIDCVIIDEAHRIKNIQAKTTKWVHKNLGEVQRRILLTGTPIKSRPIEYFSLLKFIDKKKWTNYIKYGMEYCNGYNGRFGYDFSGASNLIQLHRETSPYMIRRNKSEVLTELPEKIYTRTPIQMDKKQTKEYRALEAIYQSGAAGQKTAYHLAKLQEMKQLTSNVKVEAAKEIIQTMIDAGQKVVVFSQYVDITRNIYNTFFGKSVIITGETNQEDRHRAVTEFQNNDKQLVFCGTIGAAGVGLTLTASNNVLFIDLPWTPGDFEQACDRCHRIGQKNSVNIVMLECTDTIDEYIAGVLYGKQTVISKVLDNKNYVATTQISIMDEVIKMMSKKRTQAKKLARKGKLV